MAKYIDEGEFGIVEYGGKRLRLTEQPYAESDVDNPEGYFTATAVDAEGNEYHVRWETTNAYKAAFRQGGDAWENFDDGDACNWDSCVVLE